MTPARAIQASLDDQRVKDTYRVLWEAWALGMVDVQVPELWTRTVNVV